ncbi:MAG TPA: glycosyltransferase [Candidatus Acidoferrum sp.]|nr:glycosyltransferase [Candidatus Acidoferrum sp.]
MRILNVTETYAPFLEFGGPPVKVRALSEGLARRGHQVTVLTADWGLEKRMQTQEEKSQAERSPFGWRRQENGVQAIYVPTWLRYRTVSWNPAVNRYCRARLQNFDVVHIFGLYDLLGPAVAAESRERGLPYAVEPIGMFVPIVRNFLLKRIYHAVWGRRLLQGASAVIATSEQEIEELVSGGISRPRVVLRRNGVEVPPSWPEQGKFRKSLGISRQEKLVLFLGRLSAKKSPDLLLEAFAELSGRSSGVSMMLVFAGPDEGGQKLELEKMAANLGIRTKVQFAGPLFGEMKWAAYRDADVFVLPSQNENFGNTAAEAVAARTPVIVTEQCGIAPLLVDEAGLVVPHEKAALSKALERVLGDAELASRLAAGSANVTSRLGWDEPVREMETLYAALASQRGDSAESKRAE